MNSTSCGIEAVKTFIKQKKLDKKRVGALCHPSSITKKWLHLRTILESNSRLKALFGPQHGIHGETQDNMIEWQNFKDPKGIPIYSLYGETRKPSAKSLEELDFMFIDLFDIGARYYTFIYTMAYMLEACAKKAIPVAVCDRPNPLGGRRIEGPLLSPHFRSFVGLYEIPICHAMTIGELAKFFADQMDPKPALTILPLKNWKRTMHFPETLLPWTLPSPNMPSYQTALFFPGMCLLEATTLSEGRGTTRPFELLGAPFCNWHEIEKVYYQEAHKLELYPVIFHRQGFIPSFHKYQNEMCYGALQSCPSPKYFQPVKHGALLLWVLKKLYGNEWTWKMPPYEYEYEKLPIDILAGSSELRETIDQQKPLKKLFKKWRQDEKDFQKKRKPFLLYS